MAKVRRASDQQLAAARPVRAGGSVTLRDVAAAARTTPMTVSNVINGRKGQVGAEMVTRVLAACAKLDYRPNANARQLRTNRRMTVGVIIADASPHYLSDPFIAALLAGLNDVMQAAGYSIVLQGASPGELASLPLLRRIESDGLFLLLSGSPAQRGQTIEQVAALGQPLVVIQDPLPQAVADACSLIQDDEGGGAAIARHLFARSCRKAVMLVPSVAWSAMERREAGIRAVLQKLADPPAFEVVYCGDEGFDGTQAAFAAYVAQHGFPDVVIGGNDRMAIAAMKWLISQGREVPGQTRVSGFNGFDFWRYASPELTTVLSPAFQLGEEGARALLERLETGAFTTRQRVLPVEFSPNVSSRATPARRNSRSAGADGG